MRLYGNLTLLQGLDGLAKLQKLFLSHNRIRCVEGLSTCVSLQELQANPPPHFSSFSSFSPHPHPQIVDQRMGPDETLSFDPRTLHGLSGCLSVLDISKNNVRDLNCPSTVYFCDILRM